MALNLNDRFHMSMEEVSGKKNTFIKIVTITWLNGFQIPFFIYMYNSYFLEVYSKVVEILNNVICFLKFCCYPGWRRRTDEQRLPS